jgi:hypothetical protein
MNESVKAFSRWRRHDAFAAAVRVGCLVALGLVAFGAVRPAVLCVVAAVIANDAFIAIIRLAATHRLLMAEKPNQPPQSPNQPTIVEPPIATPRVRVLEGEVRMVDLDGGVAMLLVAPDVRVWVNIANDQVVADRAEQEQRVTSALHDHRSVRLRVRGPALHSEAGAVMVIDAQRVAIVRVPDPDAPCEALFERLAIDDPARLLSFLEPGKLEPHALTYAAEIAGQTMAAGRVVDPLLRLLDDPCAVVREGAIYGISHHAADERVLARLSRLAAEDPSPGVRAAATGAMLTLPQDGEQ